MTQSHDHIPNYHTRSGSHEFHRISAGVAVRQAKHRTVSDLYASKNHHIPNYRTRSGNHQFRRISAGVVVRQAKHRIVSDLYASKNHHILNYRTRSGNHEFRRISAGVAVRQAKHRIVSDLYASKNEYERNTSLEARRTSAARSISLQNISVHGLLLQNGISTCGLSLLCVRKTVLRTCVKL